MVLNKYDLQKHWKLLIFFSNPSTLIGDPFSFNLYYLSTRMALSQRYAFHYYCRIAEFYENEKSVDFLHSYGFLPTAVFLCPLQNSVYLWKKRNYGIAKKSYDIPKIKKRYYFDYSVSDFKCFFVDNTNIPQWIIVFFVNHFITHLWDHRPVTQYLNMSSKSLVDWWSFCCEVTDKWFSNQELIGREGTEVETDETLVICS